jgi:DNA-binding protein H-NS
LNISNNPIIDIIINASTKEQLENAVDLFLKEGTKERFEEDADIDESIDKMNDIYSQFSILIQHLIDEYNMDMYNTMSALSNLRKTFLSSLDDYIGQRK